MSDYDFIVLGGGSAGYAAARTAAELDLKTAVIEGGEEMGGLCILRGCMPSKSVIESANRFITLRRAGEFGLSLENPSVDMDHVMDRKEVLISDFAGYRREQLQTGPFDLIRGRARFLDAHRVEVDWKDEKRVVSGKSFLIATGSVIPKPPFEGVEKTGYLTSDDMLRNRNLPNSIVVLGGGAIALEAAHFYEGLGSRVTLIQRSPQVLKEMDADVAGAVEKAFRDRGMEVVTDTSIQRWERRGDKKVVVFEKGGQKMEAVGEEILAALGRSPNTEGLGLDQAGVRQAGRAVACNRFQQSSQDHIFAAGDVCGPYEIVHIAINQGELAARNAARLLKNEGRPLEPIDYRLRLMGIFCEPQVASLGHTEKSAKESDLPIRTASHAFADHGKSMVRGEMEGFVKLLAHADSGELLGAAVVGPEATELIHEIVVAMSFRATAADLAAVPHYHPTLSEIWTYPAEALA